MALESFSGIWSLNVSNPGSGDDVGQGDDHLRGIKTAVTSTFPNVSATVNVTHTVINYLDGAASNIQAQLDTLSDSVAALNQAQLAGYGGLAISAGSSPVCSATTSPTDIVVWNAGMPVQGLTVDTAGGSITVDSTGIYSVACSFSFSGDANTQFAVSLFQDDVSTNLRWQRFIGTGADIGSASFFGLLSANSGSVLKLRSQADDGDVGMVLHSGQFAVVRGSS